MLQKTSPLLELSTTDEFIALYINEIGIGGKPKAVLRSQILPIRLSKP
jgi:hypothetical protein